MAEHTFNKYYYCDFDNGNDGNDGTLMSTPFKTFNYAVQSMTTDGSCLFIRRGSSELKTTTYAPSMTTSDHYIGVPGVISSWPRPESVTYSGTLTNGSYKLLNLNFTTSERSHCGRYATLSDGRTYLVCKAPASDELWIDPPYKGESITTSGTILFPKDELYDLAQTLDAGDGVDVNWDDDSNDVFEIQVSGTGAYIYFSGDRYLNKYNLSFKCIHDGGGVSYLVLDSSPVGTIYKNCLFLSDLGDGDLLYARYGSFTIDGCVFRGMSSYDASQNGVMFLGCNNALMKNCAITSIGFAAIYGFGSSITLINCVAGLDVGASAYCRYGYYGVNNPNFGLTNVRSIDSDFSEAEIEDYYTGTNSTERVDITNYNRQSGTNLLLLPGTGKLYKNDCSGTDIDQRSGGSPFVYELDWDRYATSQGRRAQDGQSTEEWLGGNRVLEHDFILTSGTWSIKYYVQASGSALTLEESWMEIIHYSGLQYFSGDMQIYKSNNSISMGSGASDWSQYLWVSGISVYEDTYTKARVYHARYDATNRVYIDPQPEIIKTA